jgi:uncharacterized protein YndB with AHSA1/START domain
MMSKLNLVAEAGSLSITTTRVFDAPRELVFKALTDPKLIPQWWGPRSVTTIVDKMDVRMGGVWRYLHQDNEGNSSGFRGVYHEISAPERLVFTFEWEGMPGHILLETMSLSEENGKTIVTDSSVFQTVEDRDGMLQSGMADGAEESFIRLDTLLKTF